MKQVRFRARRISDNKLVRGNWFVELRPNNPQRTAEMIVGERLKNFVVVVRDMRTKMIMEEI